MNALPWNPRPAVSTLVASSFVAALGLGAVLGAGASGCAFTGRGGGCNSDLDCRRGETCDEFSSQCQLYTSDTSTTDPSPLPNFTGQAVPMLRGRVCVPSATQLAAGAKIPLTIEPCLHPCLTPTSFRFQNRWFCNGGDCDAQTFPWIIADGVSCPVDVFGQFASTECVYPQKFDTSIGAFTIDGENINANVMWEVPFMTNDEAEALALYAGKSEDAQLGEAPPACVDLCSGGGSACLVGCYAASLTHKYPVDGTRSKAFTVRAGAGQPPATCDGNTACECYDFGF